MDPAASRSTVTRLTPSGWNEGDPRAVAWATELSRRIADRCGPTGLRFQIASYRLLGREALAVDIDGPRGGWSMQFHAERGATATTLDDSDVTVPDLVEAIHLASMIAHHLGAAVHLGWAAELERWVPKLQTQET